MLRSLERVVVLFDEIDQFLLDRNSEFYHKQSDVFKFMTPGMLTKFQDLRDECDCVFIVATNYYERIDSAIKRRGRIDDHLLLNLPNKARRAAIIYEFAKPVFPTLLAPDDFLALAGADALLTQTAFFGWGDLKYLVESTAKPGSGLTTATLCGALAAAAGRLQPAVNLSAYRRRFEGSGPYPAEEFFLLAYLLVDAAAAGGAVFSAADEEQIERVIEVLGLTNANYDADMPALYVREAHVATTLKPALQPFLP